MHTRFDDGPGTVILGVRPDGQRFVTLADDTIAVDLDETNRILAAENERIRATGPTAPLAEDADGRLVLDDTHVYQLVRRDRYRPEVATYRRVETIRS